MDTTSARPIIAKTWDDSIIPSLVEYIRIPNQSPHFDPDWEANGHMQRAMTLISDWCRDHMPEDASLEVLQLPGRTPLMLIDVPAQGGSEGTLLLYGHMDKQPAMTGWEAGLGPWTPVIRDGRLYGRGGADDGYAAFASVTALNELRRQGLPHARAVILIEGCEESGSEDLPAYLELLGDRLGEPDLVICLDSGCANYDQLWCTTSLRGLLVGTLRVDVLREGVHSGDAGGIVPETFGVLRRLLARLEDDATGVVTLDELQVEIPAARRAQAATAVEALSGRVSTKYPFLEGVRAFGEDPVEQVLARTWRAAVAVTGAEGLPPLANAGNVLRPGTAVKLSVRLPPTCDPARAAAAVRRTLTRDPPQGARVSFDGEGCRGWNAPALAPWLEAALEEASQAWFGRPACSMGEGGTIPFMAMLGERFPAAQFMITGLLGPGSNAHGPNEFLHIEAGKRLTGCVAQVIARHGRGVS